MDFTTSKTLFGHDPAERIVAVEPADEGGMQVYRRETDGSTRCDLEDFRPFAWVAGGIEPPGFEVEKLSGGLRYDTLLIAPDWKEMSGFRKALRLDSIDHFMVGDPVQQYLMRSGRTLFKGMQFEDLRRMQIDIETYCDPEFEFPNPERETDHVLAIAMSDSSGWEDFLVVDCNDPARSEKTALKRLSETVAERDPDVIEGHNLFNFDLDYLHRRARRHRVKLGWGRDGSRIKARASRLQVAERTINYTRFDAHGRHFVDTFLLAQFYDVGTRELEGFGLKEVARHFGVQGGDGRDDRVLLEGREIQQAGFEDPETFRKYALQDVRETRALSDLLSRSYFTQSQMFPYSYQNVVVRGNATKIDTLFLREYLRQGHSIPPTPDSRHFEGGYTDVFLTGVAKPVWHCDVTSLYPSLMLASHLFPAADSLGIFHGMLSELRQFRIDAKRRMRELSASGRDTPDFPAAKALQSTFKILINSFYGYLGFPQAHFADFDQAAEVTRQGRDLLRRMVEWLERQGATLVEADTDGVYFIPPDSADAASLHEALRRDVLPEGIDVEFDTDFEAMFSYKAKNYALLRTSGELVVKGGALRSRGLEKFQREFMERMVRHLIAEAPEKVHAMHREFREAIESRSWDVNMLAKTETLQDSLAKYRQKIASSSRNRAASYELALQSEREYQPGDQISYYVTGTRKRVAVYENCKLVKDWNPENRDENIAYYLGKLDDLVKKFEDFL